MAKVVVLARRYHRGNVVSLALAGMGLVGISLFMISLALRGDVSAVPRDVLWILSSTILVGMASIAMSIWERLNTKARWEEAQRLAQELHISHENIRLPKRAKVELGILEGVMGILNYGSMAKYAAWIEFRPKGGVLEADTIDIAALRHPYTLVRRKLNAYMLVPAVRIRDLLSQPIVLCYLGSDHVRFSRDTIRLAVADGQGIAKAMVRLGEGRLWGWLEKAPGRRAARARLELVGEIPVREPGGQAATLAFNCTLATVREGTAKFSCDLGPGEPILAILYPEEDALLSLKELTGGEVAWGLSRGRYGLRLVLASRGRRREATAELPIARG